jgi:NAD-dependent deacetylase
MAAYRDIPDALISALRDARHVCVLTGAGVSAESGVPTFREAQDGLWSHYNPQDLATPDAFRADPKLVWRWYRWRRELVADAQPNPGHLAIAQLEQLVPLLSLVTQNVDNLHQRAGSKRVVEFHGNLFEDRCYADGTRHIGDDTLDVPTCPDCGGHLRPGVVWFGEAIPEEALNESCAAAVDCDVFLSVGTSSVDALVVEINPEPTISAASCDFAIAEKSGVVLPKLVESLSL